MRAMKSSLPIFIFVGLAMFAVIGIIVLEAGATSASMAVNNSSTEALSTGLYGVEYAIMFGVGAVLLLLAGYFALKTFA